MCYLQVIICRKAKNSLQGSDLCCSYLSVKMQAERLHFCNIVILNAELQF